MRETKFQLYLSVSERSAWTPARNCLCGTPASTTRSARPRASPESPSPSRVSCGRRDPSSSSRRCPSGASWASTPSARSSAPSSARTAASVTARRGPRSASEVELQKWNLRGRSGSELLYRQVLVALCKWSSGQNTPRE